MKRYIDFYLTEMKLSIQERFQYRVQNLLFLVMMLLEPVIYLVVWSSIAQSQGGSVAGYTAGGFAAYYIVWTLVRQMNVVRDPFEWERRIRIGRLSHELLRPIHPIHHDIALYAGWKVVMIMLWLPLAVILTFLFKPSLHPGPVQILVFFAAIWGAYFLRTAVVSLLGLITFWTTRVGAIYDLFFALELVLSGRLVPMPLMPEWVQRLGDFLPFQWAFYFPIHALTGSQTNSQLLLELGIQVLWILASFGLLRIVWHFAIRRFSSVGN